MEAALDDTNLRRLAAYIDSLRDETQLIMITHQRRTMEMADVLFGVSMPGRRRHQGHQPKARPGPQARGVGGRLGARYEIGELEYASGYEKMYGVTDEQLAFLSRHQDNLRRFEVEPTYDAALDADLERLARKRDELSRHGFDAAREAGSASEAFRVEFAHATTALEGNGLTLAETAMVLERDLTIPGKPLHDHLEVMDADAAFTRVRKLAADGAPLSEEIVFDVHRLIAAHLEEADPGEYRWDMRYVTSSSMYPPPPARVRN